MLFAVVAFTACNNAPKEEVITEEATTEVTTTDDATTEVTTTEENTDEATAADANVEVVGEEVVGEAPVEATEANEAAAAPEKEVKEVIAE